jgi:hypothetical protein
MRRRVLVSSLVAGLLLAGDARAGEEVSVDSTPPVVVATSPRAGDLAVDPATRGIRVTFSKEMMTQEMWSWVVHSKESFPKVAGDVHYLADRRTCVLPVALEPGKAYAIWVNSPSHDSFRDTGQRPAVPYLLVFETRE